MRRKTHFHCNLVSRRLGVMRQLVPDEYCRGHHSRIIYIKVFLQYITYYTVIRLQGSPKLKLTITLIFWCWQRQRQRHCSWSHDILASGILIFRHTLPWHGFVPKYGRAWYWQMVAYSEHCHCGRPVMTLDHSIHHNVPCHPMYSFYRYLLFPSFRKKMKKKKDLLQPQSCPEKKLSLAHVSKVHRCLSSDKNFP